jgi:MOSC domain-containing protein YiiM
MDKHNKGYIEAICTSDKKGRIKKAVDSAMVDKNWGIVDDAHAGPWHRQISLLAGENIDTVKKQLPGLKHGDFAENIVTRGIDLSELMVGDRLQVADQVLLEVTQIGKECHNAGCAIKKATGDCIMPKQGLFTRVIQGGKVTKGCKVKRVVER